MPKDCTCTGTCRGPEGLGEGWACVLGRRRACDELELGFTGPEIRSRLRTAILDGLAAGYDGRKLFVYLRVVNPLIPGSRESRAWNRERRRILGRVRRHREAFLERQDYLFALDD
jgi:hypothetical protein